MITVAKKVGLALWVLAFLIKFFCTFILKLPRRVYYLQKILNAVVPARWYSFKELCEIGCPEEVVRDLMCLVSSHPRAVFEARVRPELKDILTPECMKVLDLELAPKTAELFEYRLTEQDPEPEEAPNISSVPAYA